MVEQLVLLSDRSAEGHELAEALRDAGFSVVSSDVVALPERVARLRPLAVLVDVEQAHSPEALQRIREQVGSRPGTLVLPIAEPDRLTELGIALTAPERAFARPLDPPAIMSYLRELVFGAPSSSTPGSSKPGLPAPRTSSAEPSAPSRASTPGLLDSETLLADFPALADLPEIDAMLPEGESQARIAARRLSPEIEALLETSARYARELGSGAADPPAADVLVNDEDLAQIEQLLRRDEPERSSKYEQPLDSDPPPAPRTAPAQRSSAPTTGLPQKSEPPATVADLSQAAPRSAAATHRADFSRAAPRSTTTTQPADATVAPLRPGESSTPGASPIFSPPRESSATSASREAFDSSAARPRTDRPSREPELDDGSTVFLARDSEPPNQDGAIDSEPPATRAQLPQGSFASEARAREPALPEAPSLPSLELDKTNRGDTIALVAQAIRSRSSGALRLASEDGARVRYLLLRDGDIVTATSELESESLINLLIERGDLPADWVRDRAARLPRAGRHAAAALIAQGFLSQDDLWPVLRAHAEWTLGRALREGSGVARLLADPPDRLGAEPSVFGGATGVEVFVEVVRRVVRPNEAVARLGGDDARLAEGPLIALLHESALDDSELRAVAGGRGRTLGAVVQDAPEAAALIYAFVALDVLRAIAPSEPLASPAEPDALDAEAIRARVALRTALVREGDYFALLGVARDATSYDLRRAYLALRRSFEPARLLTAATADLNDEVLLILEVFEEAYQVLRDEHRRSRYRRAIEATSR